MAVPTQVAVSAERREEPLAFLMIPWVDKTIAVIAIVPSIWLVYIRLRRFSFDLPLVVVAIHALVFIATMITRRLPVRVSRNPWFWLLTFVETYWVVLVFAVMSRGHAVAPNWATDSLAILSGLLLIWARLSLGRSIGLVPALRSLVTRGAYGYVRHPIYSAYCLSFVAAGLNAYSRKNLTLFALGIFWFLLKSVAEESFLRSDAGYADYMKRVRWRWLPSIA